MTHNFLLYLAFGDRDKNGLEKELICSLLSFHKVSQEATKRSTQIIIYSNSPFAIPESLKELSIRFVSLSKDEVDDTIKKNNGFNLALKINILLNFLKQTDDGNILLVDTDTFFIKDPVALFESIKKGKVIMHLKEPSIDRRPALKRYLTQKNVRDLHGKYYKLNTNFEIWNSGVVGLNHSLAHRIESALYLLEQLTEDNNSHILEQLSLSYFLQLNSKIVPADKYIVHYYFYKPFVHILGRYFNFNSHEDAGMIQKLKQQSIIPEKIGYDKLSRYLIKQIKHSFIEWHFFCLPPNTHIGRILIKEFLYDKKYYKDVLRAQFKIMFNTYKLWDYNLRDKTVKDRYAQ